MKLTDTHCHLYLEHFDDDREQVINRAIENGIERILIPGIDLNSSRSAINLAERFPQVFAAVGVHPNSGSEWNEDTFAKLMKLSKHDKVVAIGEIGLDFFHEHKPKQVQENIFREQLELAKDTKLPVVVHHRNATTKTIQLLNEWYKTLEETDSELVERPGVLHSYSGDIKQYEQAKAMNLFVGVTGPITYNNANLLREVILEVDLNQVLIETDAPFLSPHPFRGKRNEPARVRIVADKIADLRGISNDELAKRTYNNAARLFEW
ncbi:MAG: TatD family deoxyribonuclease [Chloroflexi bacterium]|nr:TatD family deoxyribonuclease [Chloroflexota bacterium]